LAAAASSARLQPETCRRFLTPSDQIQNNGHLYRIIISILIIVAYSFRGAAGGGAV
jgi:hypothetical protein